jgi:hypothetical protein
MFLIRHIHEGLARKFGNQKLLEPLGLLPDGLHRNWQTQYQISAYNQTTVRCCEYGISSRIVVKGRAKRYGDRLDNFPSR